MLVTDIDTTKKLQSTNKIIYVKNVALYLEHNKNPINFSYYYDYSLIGRFQKFSAHEYFAFHKYISVICLDFL